MEIRVWQATVHMVGRKDLDTTEQLTLSFHLMTLQIKKQCECQDKAYNFSKRKIRSQLASIKNSPEQAGTHVLEISLYCLTSEQLTLIDITCSQCIFFHFTQSYIQSLTAQGVPEGTRCQDTFCFHSGEQQLRTTMFLLWTDLRPQSIHHDPLIISCIVNINSDIESLHLLTTA